MPDITVLGEYKCPNCGGSDRVFDTAHKKLEDRKVHAHFELAFMKRDTIPLVDPSRAALSIPVVNRFWDTCMGCGKDYIFRIEMLDAPIQFQPVPKQATIQR